MVTNTFNPAVYLKALFLLFLGFPSFVARADEVKNLAELALLPNYCKGTQQIRSISKDPKSIQQYELIYGETFRHLHHYCWALNSENNAVRIKDRYLRQSKLIHALDDYQYFLDRAPPTFPFLPNIYTSRAGVLFKLNRNVEAIQNLNKAIELKADYALAYSRLSTYYQSVNDKGGAIKIIEQALDNSIDPASVNFFTKELEKLGKSYQGIEGSAAAKKDTLPNANSSVNQIEKESNSDNNLTAAPTETSLPETKKTTPDIVKPESTDTPPPYCRFCP